MNQQFNPTRFGRYVVYDIVNSWKRYGVSAIIIGMFPLIFFVFFKFFSVLFGAPGTHFPDNMKVVSLVCVMCIMVVSIPAKLYGFVTEKKVGANWLMIPASALEKCIWMCIMMCFVVPVSIGLVYAASDFFLSVLFPEMYGSSVIVSGLNDISGIVSLFRNDYLYVTSGGLISSYLNLCASILFFTLGALVFKSGKPAKTILSLIILMSLLTSLLYLIFRNADMTGLLDGMDMKRAQLVANVVCNVYFLLVFSVLVGGIYYRIRRLKQ